MKVNPGQALAVAIIGGVLMALALMGAVGLVLLYVNR